MLKKSLVDCIGDEECEAKLRTTKLGPYYNLNNNFLCAQTQRGQACLIDGGGPLVCKRRDNSYALVGLVSWAVECDNPNVPEAYVRVQNYLDWIGGSSYGQESGQKEIPQSPAVRRRTHG